MAQAYTGERSRRLVIRRSSSKPSRDEVAARIPDVEWEVARDVCLRKYGVRARAVLWEHASLAQRKAAELLPVTYISKVAGESGYAQMGDKPLVLSAAGRAR